MRVRGSLQVFPIIILLASSFVVPRNTASSNVATQPLGKSQKAVGFVNYSRVQGYLADLSTIGSRVTGYPGNLLAENYLTKAFEELGLETKTHEFEVTVPLDQGTSITVISPVKKVFQAYPMWPNGVQTCPTSGLKGKLAYAAGTTAESFDGVDLKDSILLMEFNSADSWLFAANMGAKAAIFIEPRETSTHEAISKFTEAPIHFPRLYVKKDVGDQLRYLVETTGSEVQVRLDSRMAWRKTTSRNIIGVVNGTQYPTDVIIVASHYDTWSVVPDVAYGANDALGIAFLLELANYFRTNRPTRTVWLVALSGHWQAMTGGREFLEDFYFSEDVQEGIMKPWAFINLGPFSSDTSGIQLLGISYYAGAGQGLGTLQNRYVHVTRQIHNKYLVDPDLSQAISELTGQTPKELFNERLQNLMWWGSMDEPYILESELVLMTGGVGFSVVSSPCFAHDRLFGIPINDLDSVVIEKLKPQFEMTGFILASLVNESEWQLDWEEVKPLRSIYIGYSSVGRTVAAGYLRLRGNVAFFNYSTGWYENVPDAIVCLRPVSNNYPFSKIITIADENGSFEIHGIPPFFLAYKRSRCAVEGWVLNETDGTILYALDLGIHGTQTLSNLILPVTDPVQTTVVVANLRSITIFDTLDLSCLRPWAILDPRTSLLTPEDTYVGTGGTVIPLNLETKSEYLTYSSYNAPSETLSLVFVPPYSESVINTRSGGGTSRAYAARGGQYGAGWPTFLTNSSEGVPEGSGLLVADKPLTIHFSAYQFTEDMYRTTKYRYDHARDRNVRSPSVEDALNKTETYLRLAKEACQNNTYSLAHSYALLAYASVNRAYLETMGLIEDAANTTIAFLVFIIITSFLIEGLLVSTEKGSRRVIALMSIIAILTLALSQLHPSFQLMSN